ncbi:AbrB/MazE/SpoVT family DNA-binding domain-containing protein [Nocardia amamiensis]|uniref:AbrB/MazE/SpoVT family DNA-binding domain-containing protein n=1 Tax=Nocardia amamiensis TaxID=404578 RepID=A0ABS0D5M0_9NOCA|nr:AbrB/MazE/SpoVT family DNA-binding domain-containing protein [Nocardia amamiensis]MBF6302474.1 AbrB/MazE/SpoVT family DNA-binding domain-containing protein [Nocardia amamiensis]
MKSHIAAPRRFVPAAIDGDAPAIERSQVSSPLEDDEFFSDFARLYNAGSSRSDVPKALAPHFAFPEGPDEAPIAALHCSVTAINRRGRLSAKSLLSLLGWGPGQRFSFDVDQTLVKVRRSGAGWPLGNDGFLVLPADVRNRSNINAGDRILMAASLQHDLLVVYPPKALTAALWACYPDLWEKAS